MSWFCATCNTQAPRPELCSGCGTPMRVLDHALPNVQFMLCLGDQNGMWYYEYIGPFDSVLAADQWWMDHQHKEEFHMYSAYEVTPLRKPT